MDDLFKAFVGATVAALFIIGGLPSEDACRYAGEAQ